MAYPPGNGIREIPEADAEKVEHPFYALTP
jgi:hypothetical protein